MPVYTSSPSKSAAGGSKISRPRKSFPAPLTRLKFIPQRPPAARLRHRPASLAQAGPTRGTPIKMGGSPSKSSSSPAGAPGLRKLRLLNASTLNLHAPLPPPPAAVARRAVPPSVLPSGSPVKKRGLVRELSTPELVAAFPAPPSRPAPPPQEHLFVPRRRQLSLPAARAAGRARPGVINFSRPLPRQAGAEWPQRCSSLPVHPRGPVGVAVSEPLANRFSQLQEEKLEVFEPQQQALGGKRGEMVWPLANMEKPLPPLPKGA
ncbi:hypothetical protein GTA08_BOTSDO08445 [Botryosphaeria dothidea]|uniref:Uncharacterized protein n=1 Tax=Botryosphaeria dothidea TaxID=55169 RepID=A0A8H4IPT0_9PEZI|nr:hypothetical protein GTA08_BOTSDO08445 [Botryosphaeria dothidea]